jgi:nitronate monooxygenase
MSWHRTGFSTRLGLRWPIVQAPMAGGWTTPSLVAEVCGAGGLGSIAGAMLSPEVLRAQIRDVRRRTDRPFAVNLFAPLPPPTGRGLQEWADLFGVAAPQITATPGNFAGQLSVVVDEQVPVLSFTFGIPPLDGVDCFTIGTATSVAEAIALEEAGVDALVAQGFEAGGHRGSFLTPPMDAVGTLALVPQVVDAVSVPVIASGGIMDGRGIAAARLLGAQAVAMGTAFLRAAEAGTGPAYRAALDGPSTLTSVLTGRLARAVRTPLLDRLEHSGVRPPDYPLPRSFLTEPPFLAGQGGRMARSMPAGKLIELLAAETATAIADIKS